MTERTINSSPLTVRRTLAVPWPLTASALTLCFILGARVVETFSLPLPRCTFRALTGLPCLSCGTTRCLTALSHFDLMLAFHFNPLATSLAMMLLASPLILPLRASLRLSACSKKCLTTFGIVAVAVNWTYLIFSRI